MKRIFFKNVLLILSLLFFVFTYNFDQSDPRSWVSFIPLIFGILYYLVAPVPKDIGVGYIMLNIVMISKYLLYPFFYVNSNYFSPFNSIMLNYAIKESYFYLIVEMVLILSFLKMFYKKKNRISKVDIEESYSYKLPILLSIILIIIFVVSPGSYSNFSFIISKDKFIFDKEFVGSTSFIFFIKWALYIIPLFIFNFFFERYKRYSKTKFLILSVLPLIFASLFYFSTSRLSILLPLLSFWFVLIKYYPEHSRLLSVYFLGYGISSMIFLSLIKFFSASNLSSVAFSYDAGSFFLNSYFHGIPNIALGIQAAEKYNDFINFSNIFDELFSQVMFVNDYFDTSKRTNFYFNSYLSTNSNIVPTVTTSSMLFGKFLFWILTPFFTLLICFFDRLSFETTRIDKTFIFSFFSVSVAFFIYGNLTLISDSFFTYFVPLTILCYLNRFIFNKSKIKFK